MWAADTTWTPSVCSPTGPERVARVECGSTDYPWSFQASLAPAGRLSGKCPNQWLLLLSASMRSVLALSIGPFWAFGSLPLRSRGGPILTAGRKRYEYRTHRLPIYFPLKTRVCFAPSLLMTMNACRVPATERICDKIGAVNGRRGQQICDERGG
jgi:hypothetical protein